MTIATPAGPKVRPVSEHATEACRSNRGVLRRACRAPARPPAREGERHDPFRPPRRQARRPLARVARQWGGHRLTGKRRRRLRSTGRQGPVRRDRRRQGQRHGGKTPRGGDDRRRRGADSAAATRLPGPACPQRPKTEWPEARVSDGLVKILDGNTFVVSDSRGDIEASLTDPTGLFSFDTRFLSQWILTVNGQG